MSKFFRLPTLRSALLLSASLFLPNVNASEPVNLVAGREFSTTSTAFVDSCGNSIALLTDGKYSKDLDRELLGWGFSGQILLGMEFDKPQNIAAITIDSLTIRENTLAERIIVYASDNGSDFFEIGTLKLKDERGNKEEAGIRPCSYTLEGIDTKVRHLRIGIITKGTFLVNEIIVTPGNEGQGKAIAGTPVSNPELHLMKLSTELHALRRIKEDYKTFSVEFLNRVNKSSLSQETKKEFISRLKPLRDTVFASAVEVEDPLLFKTILPFNDAHAELYSLFGVLAEAQNAEPLEVRTDNRWAGFSIHVDGEGNRIEQPLKLAALAGETRTAAFTVGNATAKPQSVRIALKNLDPVAGEIELSQTVWTDSKMKEVNASALLPLKKEGQEWLLELPAGMKSMVWIKFHPEEDLTAKQGAGAFVVSGSQSKAEVPVEWAVTKGVLPKERSMHLGGWDYLSRVKERTSTYVDNQTIDSIQDFLTKYDVDTPWASQIFGHGSYDEEGNMVTKPSVEAFNNWVAMWPNARKLGVFNHSDRAIDGKEIGTPAFSKAVRQWARFWTDHIESLGLKQEIFLLLVDEPGFRPDQVPSAVAWSTALRSETDRFTLWTDPIFKDPANDAPKEYWDSHDVYCPLTNNLIENPVMIDFYRKLKEEGKRIHVYSCDGPSSGLDPYHYYRLQSWVAADLGAKAQFFWDLSNHRQPGLSWNEYINTYLLYTPQFIGRDGVASSRQMEGIREGMNDFEYFVLLKKLVAEAREKGVAGPLASQAEELLKSSPGRLLKGREVKMTKIATAADRDTADQVVAEFRTLIAQLTEALADQPGANATADAKEM